MIFVTLEFTKLGITRKGSMIPMLVKSALIPISFIGLGLFISVVVGSAVAWPQGALSVHVFGLTIENIYDRGVIITDVDLGSRARQIGILKDDVILEVNGVPVFGTYEFRRLINAFGGQPLYLTVSRLGDIGTFVIMGQ